MAEVGGGERQEKFKTGIICRRHLFLILVYWPKFYWDLEEFASFYCHKVLGVIEFYISIKSHNKVWARPK